MSLFFNMLSMLVITFLPRSKHLLISWLQSPSIQILTYQFSHSVVSTSLRTHSTPWTTAHQASLSITNSQSLLKLMPIELVMPSNHLILCCPLLLLPSIFPSNRVFSNESVLHIRWPTYWSFSLSISPSNEYSRLISDKTWSTGEGKGYPVQYSGLKNSIDCTVHGVTKSWTQPVPSLHDK